jgi:quinol monooxygenase YgiN
MISLLAVLTAKPGQTDALRQALQALLLPTTGAGQSRLRPVSAARCAGYLLYARILAQPGSAGRAYRPAHFQDFIAQMDSLLAGPLRLDYLTPVAP